MGPGRQSLSGLAYMKYIQFVSFVAMKFWNSEINIQVLMYIALSTHLILVEKLKLLKVLISNFNTAHICIQYCTLII